MKLLQTCFCCKKLSSVVFEAAALVNLISTHLNENIVSECHDHFSELSFLLNTELSSSDTFEDQNFKFCILSPMKFTTILIFLQWGRCSFTSMEMASSTWKGKAFTSVSICLCRFWFLIPDCRSSYALKNCF